MKPKSESAGFVHTCRTISEIEGLDQQQTTARDLFVERVGMTMLEATSLVMEIGPARSAELKEVLQGCTGTGTETLVKLLSWQPRRPY